MLEKMGSKAPAEVALLHQENAMGKLVGRLPAPLEFSSMGAGRAALLRPLLPAQRPS
jgi:hypothetical protein